MRADAPRGRAILNLRQQADTMTTQLNEGRLNLNPDPSDRADDPLDGAIQMGGKTTRPAPLLARDLVFAAMRRCR